MTKRKIITSVVILLLIYTSLTVSYGDANNNILEGFTYSSDLMGLGNIYLSDIIMDDKIEPALTMSASLNYTNKIYKFNVDMKMAETYGDYHGEGELLYQDNEAGTIVISTDRNKQYWSGILLLEDSTEPIYFVINNEKFSNSYQLKSHIAKKTETNSNELKNEALSSDENILTHGYFGNGKYYGEFVGSPRLGVHSNVYGARVRLTQSGYDFFNYSPNGQDPRYARIRLLLSGTSGKGPYYEYPGVYPNNNTSSPISISLSYQLNPVVQLSVSYTPSSANYSSGIYDSWAKVDTPSLSNFRYSSQYDTKGTGVNFVVKMQGSTPNNINYSNTGYMYISVYNYYDHYYFEESASFPGINIKSNM